jgi:hypothetical protein
VRDLIKNHGNYREALEGEAQALKLDVTAPRGKRALAGTVAVIPTRRASSAEAAPYNRDFGAV